MMLKLFILVFIHVVIAIPSSKDSGIIEYKEQILQKVPDAVESRSYFISPQTIADLIGSWIGSIFKVFRVHQTQPESKNEAIQSGSLDKIATNILRIFGTTRRRSNPYVEICEDRDGVVLNNECQIYFVGERASFDNARSFCQLQGGDLWTPDLRDPFLYQKLMKYMPQITGTAEDSMWIGYQQINGRTLSITGEDVSDAFLVQIFDGRPQNNRCFLLDFANGQFKAMDTNCNDRREFVCEFPFDGEMPESSITENQIL